ncbi:MAG: GNAT family N-acetyltransferase [Methanolobus sp.]|uniref:GNAT family N-acetyltransferase n=1 Tax=Methanolobus sp. TaxID=1874737 RepID=UPI00273033F9|nr:GNAT family N-acetyltransferase [Methanolobus sp.]MDP2215740.1 GNAT family N-acetyltransferase [Methanolobus sp.]
MSVNDMCLLHKAGNVSYCLLESEDVIDSLRIEVGQSGTPGFNYFHNNFGIPYDFLMKTSVSSGHALFVSIDACNRLLGFARFEKVSDNIEKIHRGKKNVVRHSVHLLRSIEVHPSHRNMGIGRLLFAIAAKNLRSNVITKPDNHDAARFFKERLMFDSICGTDCIVLPRYRDCLLLPYPKARLLLRQLAGNYPRMVMPELVDSYEALKFRSSMGKHIPKDDILAFEHYLASSRHLLDRKLSTEMDTLLENLCT